MGSIDNTEDVIDSRDVIERIEELGATEGVTEGEAEELRSLLALAAEGESLEDWTYGVTLVRDTYFTEYAQELAEDIGAVPTENAWPLYCIDWEHAARELRMDYTALDFSGVTYWAR